MTDSNLDPFDARWLNCLYGGKLSGLAKVVENTYILIEPLLDITLQDCSKVKQFHTLRHNCKVKVLKKGDYVIFEWEKIGERGSDRKLDGRGNPEAIEIEIVSKEVAEELAKQLKLISPILFKNRLDEILIPLKQERESIHLEVEKLAKTRLKELEDELYQMMREVSEQEDKVKLRNQELELQKLEQQKVSDSLREEKKSLMQLSKEIEPYKLAVPFKIKRSQVVNENLRSLPDKLGENWQKQLQQDGLQVSKNIANSFLVSLLSGFYSGGLVLLNGSVGVGKTSIVKHSAKILRGSYEIIPVRPAWIEPADLLGFFDPISEIFRPTSFLTALKKAEDDSEKLHLICLDELNLAKIENYASDLLSKLEYSRDSDDSSKKGLLLFADEIETELFNEARFLKEQKELDSKQKARLNRLQMFQQSRQSIPQNMVLLGTLNSDETTYDLSPKVIDRSFTITYPLADFNEISKQERDLHDSFDTFSISKLREALNKEYVKNYDSLTNKKSNEWNKIQHWQKDYFSEESPLGIPLGYRTMKEYAVFYSVANRLGFSPQEAFSHFVFAKILPRISFFKADKLNQLFRKWLTELKQDHKKYDPANIIGKLERQLDDERRQTVRYWG